MADVTKTRTDLIERAATELGALPSGETLNDEDNATIDNLVDPLLLQLSLDEIVDVPDTSQIPAEWLLSLAGLLANVAAPSFGQQYSEDKKTALERQLRRLAATKPTYEVFQIQSF